MANQPKMRKRSRNAPSAATLTCGLLLGTALIPAAAVAQEATGDSSQAEQASGQLQQIVVTAQRREQNIQDTPLAVSAFTADTLEASGVTNIKELAHVDTSLNFQQKSGVFLPFLRGIGNGAAGTVGNESSVPVYIDDVYYTRLSSAYLQINSIERVEVLKGPQGTLFGRNSSGGAIQMFTKDPGRDVELNASIGYANYDTLTGQLYASVPVTDTLGWNISFGGSDQRDGWGKSITTGEDIYLEKSATVRSKLVWDPGNGTQVKLVGFYAYLKGDIGLTTALHSGSYGTTPAVPFPGYPNPPTPLPSLADSPGGFYNSRLNFRNFTREKGYGGSLRIDQETGFADLVSITAFRNSKGLYRNDSDYSGQNFFNGDFYDTGRQFTQEFQVKSKRGSTLDWIIGAYYLHSNQGYDPAQVSGDILNFAIAPGTLQLIRSRQIIDSYSVYGQATAPLSDDTNLTLGLRYTNDDVSGRGTQNFLLPNGTMIPAGPSFDGSQTFKKLTWKGAIDHHFTEDFMTYASISRGYKSGTFNTLPLTRGPALPETVDAYEIGVKSEFFDRRVRLNGALFWNDISNPQVVTIITTSTTAGVGLTNAQKSRVRGGELGFEALPTDGLTLRGAVTYLDGKYISFNPAPIYTLTATRLTGPVAGDASGNRPPNVSKWRWDLGANYSMDSTVGEFVGDVSISYTGPFAWDADNRVFEQAYTLVNASLRLTPSGMENISFGVWGKNLANEKYYLVSAEFAGPGGIGGDIAGPAAPRTYGANISVTF